MAPLTSAQGPAHLASPTTGKKAVASSLSSDEEDDYLTMSLPDPSSSSSSHSKKPQKESLTSSYKRRALLSEQRGRPKSKAELAAEEAKKRDEALSTNTMSPSNKGFKMMAALGYKPGDALGKKNLLQSSGPESGEGASLGQAGRNAPLLEPVGLEMKEGRAGIGADNERKRKFREEVERKVQGEKKAKVEEGDFRERSRLERERRRVEAQVGGAQRVCEGLEEEEEAHNGQANGDGEEVSSNSNTNANGKRKNLHHKPRLGQVNVLWRGLVKSRELAERDQRMRFDLQQSSSSLSRVLPTYTDPEEDRDDQMALPPRGGGSAGDSQAAEEVDLGLDQEDEELDAFDALEPSEKLSRLVAYLRERWNYCFWCKYRYPDKEMDGCPGLTEEDHD